MQAQTRESVSLWLLEHSPDGEPRGQIARVGDVFPLDATGHRLLASGEKPSSVRPWGLRFARRMQPRAGSHEGGTKETSGTTDGAKPSGEEVRTD
ncbi:hypothetical protein ABZ297_36870 [Nonomuraea sp. NPDC005983]|uniref:hypothetical protein n=1 Tax=Nonomuraea sp. NPDC005983 TaxID=3155595 RepID=UPI0033BE59C8